MTTLSVKLRALCFIVLLAGNSAARVGEGSQAAISVQDAAASLDQAANWATNPAEEQWKVENEACLYSWGSGCGGDGCEYRRLPLDRSYSQSCRLSDDHMLQDPKHFFLLQTEILGAKAGKFAHQCPGVSWWNARGSMRCARRSMHMMRAMEFIAKSQTNSLLESLSEEERTHQGEVHEQALQDIANVLGPVDGPIILDLQRRMMANPARIRSDPENSLLELMALVRNLLQGTDAEKEEARAAIQAMNGVSDADTFTADEETQAQDMAQNLEANMDEARQLMDRTNRIESVLNTTDSDEGGSLLQLHLEAAMESGEIEPRAVITAVMFVLVVYLLWHSVVHVISAVLGLLFLFIFVALVGCGLASALPSETGVHCGQLSGIQEIFSCEIQCARQVLRVPFSYTQDGLNRLGHLFD